MEEEKYNKGGLYFFEIFEYLLYFPLLQSQTKSDIKLGFTTKQDAANVSPGSSNLVGNIKTLSKILLMLFPLFATRRDPFDWI